MFSIITGRLHSRYLNVWASAACAGIITSGCDKLPLLAPQQSTITLSSNSNVVQANGSAEIRATVLEQAGTPVQNGTTVTFTTNLGALSPTDARTLNGVAMVQFVANGQSGVAQIKAISGGAASDALELSVGTAAVDRIVVTASPNQIPAGGTSTITARVTDSGGNPLTGVPVTFSTDVGVSSQPDLSITSSTTTPIEGQPVNFTVTVTQGSATETFQSLVVDFGDGTNSGMLGGTTQNVSHVYRSAGTYTVAATGTTPSGNSKRATTVISVADREVVNVTITKNPDTAVARNEVVTFTASATGGTVRSYSWNFGDGQTFNGSNQVSHSYSTSGNKTVTVTVSTTDGNTGRGQTQVVVNP
jgi:hypothetical protein